jgi:ABC-type uncharacterized transport system permease subunit
MHKRNNKGRLKMNIKLKAMLYTAVYTAAILSGFTGVSYLIVTITTMYPQVAAGILIVIAAATLIALIYQLMYQIILESLREK